MPEQPQLNVDIGKDAQARGSEGRIDVYSPQPSEALPTIDTRAQAPEIKTVATGAADLGASLVETEKAQIDAQHVTWLMNASSQYEVQANQMLDTARRSAAPGQPVAGLVQDGLKKLQEKATTDITNPVLAQAYTERTGKAMEGVVSRAQEFDFKERDRNAQFNFNQGLLGQQNVLSAMDNYDDVDAKYKDLAGEAMHTIETAPVAPDVKEKWFQTTVDGLGEAANRRQQQLDLKRWMSEHAYNMTPEGRNQVGDGMARGIRNNNPGNLTGDDAWQGKTGKDGDYLKFDTPENGLRALSIDLRNQQDKHGLNTVQDIITKYAPSSENDTPAYIKDVAQRMGVSPSDTINLHDPETLHRMTDAVVRHENNNAMPFAPQTVEWAAKSATSDDAGSPPNSDMAHGGVRTGNAAFNMMPYEKQQRLVTDAFQVLRQEKALGAQYVTAATTSLSNMNSNIAKGIIPSDDELKQTGEVVRNTMSPTLQQAFEKTTYRAQMTRHANGMSNDELEKTINDLDVAPQSTARDDGLAFYQTYMKTRTAAINKDPLEYWHNQGNELPALDFTKPETIKQRQQLAYQLSNQYGVSPIDSFMREDDKTYLANVLTGATPNQKLATLGTLHQNLDPAMYTGVMNTVRQNNTVMASAGDFLGLSKAIDTPHWIGKDQITTSNDVANSLVQGEALIHPTDKEKPFPLPEDKLFRTAPAGYQQVFRNLPKSEAAAMESIKAYYASDRLKNGDYSGNMDINSLNDAYSKVLGSVSKFNGDYALAPWGMNETNFRDNLETAYSDQVAKAGIDTKTFPFGSVSFQNTGQMGKYLVTNGSGYMVNAKGVPLTIDISQPPKAK